jgi:hypothetical protein
VANHGLTKFDRAHLPYAVKPFIGGARGRQTGAKPGRGRLAESRTGKEQTSRDLLTFICSIPVLFGGTRFGGMEDGGWGPNRVPFALTRDE